MSPAQRPLVVVGDTLLNGDVDGEATRLAPDAPAPVADVAVERGRPGGAGPAALLAARGGRQVVLVTAPGDDAASRAVREAPCSRVALAELPLDGTLPAKTRIRAGGRPLVRVDRGGGTPGPPGRAAIAALRNAGAVLVADSGAVLVADYGRGTAGAARPHLVDAAHTAPLAWDPHPRGERPMPGVRPAAPDAAEARLHLGSDGGPESDQGSLRVHGARGSRLGELWGAAAVAVTLGERGALLTRPNSGDHMYVPAAHRAQGDPCGAGDCFAATVTSVPAGEGLPEQAVQLAVTEAAAFVAPGGTGALRPVDALSGDEAPGRPCDAHSLAEAVRVRGGTVAAGGCFDLLRAGHVGLLQNARRTGDCPIVCVNSDASVGGSKGPGSPVNPVADRVRVLSGPGCADAVAVFDEDPPEPLLRRPRPDVRVKGGDYSADTLPEATVSHERGGQAPVLPYLDGRSTTELARRPAPGSTVHPAPAPAPSRIHR
ncbi:PfkB family carbohydrate kinase [Streptomyces sp. OE57]|uniref:PfkB family carbohydrate kinase n=1 Tax=Streptomyces lacaronensis TaxID=3379885 RepID=UPI0039B76DB8